MPVQSEEVTSEPFTVILETINECYKNATRVGPQISKCALKKLKKYKNVEGYKVYFQCDNFDKTKPINVTLTIENKLDQVFVCKGVAQQSIVFDKCTGQVIHPSNPTSRAISIIPP